jgi:hypothetical protein
VQPRPRQTSAPAARNTSRTRYSNPRQRRSAHALARWPIACSTSARSPAGTRLNARCPSLSQSLGAGRRTGACQCSPPLAMPRNPRSRMAATPAASSTPSSPDSASSACSWQLPGQPPSAHSRSPCTVDSATPGRCGRGAWRRTAPAGWSTRGAAALAWPARKPQPPRRLRPSPPGVRADLEGARRTCRRAGNTPARPAHPTAGPGCRRPGSWRWRPCSRRAGPTARRDDGPDGVQADLQGQRRVPPRPGGRGGVSLARRGGEPGQQRGRQRRAWAVCHGDQTSMAGFDTLPMVWSPSTLGRTEHHGHPHETTAGRILPPDAGPKRDARVRTPRRPRRPRRDPPPRCRH